MIIIFRSFFYSLFLFFTYFQLNISCSSVLSFYFLFIISLFALLMYVLLFFFQFIFITFFICFFILFFLLFFQSLLIHTVHSFRLTSIIHPNIYLFFFEIYFFYPTFPLYAGGSIKTGSIIIVSFSNFKN